MGVGSNKNYVQDVELLLQDADDITADAAGEISAVAQVLDLGLAFVEGDLILDFNTVDFGTADETYEIKFQLSNSPSFASGIADKLSVHKGDAISPSDIDNVATSREVVPFNNEHEGVIYRFCRLFFDVGGTTPILNLDAFLAKR